MQCTEDRPRVACCWVEVVLSMVRQHLRWKCATLRSHFHRTGCRRRVDGSVETCPERALAYDHDAMCVPATPVPRHIGPHDWAQRAGQGHHGRGDQWNTSNFRHASLGDGLASDARHEVAGDSTETPYRGIIRGPSPARDRHFATRAVLSETVALVVRIPFAIAGKDHRRNALASAGLEQARKPCLQSCEEAWPCPYTRGMTELERSPPAKAGDGHYRQPA
ncbi:hypothetical protein LIA77_05759 [Sarocladium implicatum]|nr:hypothetical protein LIA77_05759 [Sarocladium implicatum]